MAGSQILSFTFQAPRVYSDQAKSLLVTQNSSSKWKRWSEPKIKKRLKDSLGEWSVPTDTTNRTTGTVVSTILRHNKRRMDADSIAPVIKWTVDYLVEQGWFKDDDNIIFVFKPCEYNKELIETMIKLDVYDYHMI